MPAVDDRHGMPEGDYDYDEAAAIIRHDRPMTIGEVGCYLSHIKALQMFLVGSAQYAVILEDEIDIPTGTFTRLHAIATKLNDNYGEKWDCVNFGSSQRPGFQTTVFTENGIEVRRSTYMPLAHLVLCGRVQGQRRIYQVYLVKRFAVLWIQKCGHTLPDAVGLLCQPNQ